MRVWKKLASAKWADAWEERLRFLGPERVVINFLPGGKSLRLEAYGIDAAEGRLLVKSFGGSLSVLKSAALHRVIHREEPPLLIRSALVVVTSPEIRDKVRLKYPRRPVLLIPGGVAFGTGHHATTSACLRILTDKSRSLPPGDWDFLDLGTGTGILAFGARLAGARSCRALDFDADAVRTARVNARANGIRNVLFERADVLRWNPGRQWRFVAANLFSGVLQKAASRIAAAVEPGGHLLISGVLRTQEEETLAPFLALGFTRESGLRKGRWVTTLLHAPAPINTNGSWP